MTPWNKVQRHLGWKLFLSHLVVVVIGGAVLIATAQLHASSAMIRHIARVDDTIGDDPALKEEMRESFMIAVDEIMAVAATVAFLSALVFSKWCGPASGSRRANIASVCRLQAPTSSPSWPMLLTAWRQLWSRQNNDVWN
jgi:hypothetical protein